MLFSFVSRWILVTIFVCAKLGRSSGYGYSGSSDRARITKLEEKMDVLINEVSRLSDSNSANDEIPQFEPMTLVSVERTPGPAGNIFTLNINNNVQELYYIVSAGDTNIDSGVQSGEGPASIIITCDEVCDSEATVDVLFTNRTKSFDVALQLNNTGARTAYQDWFTVPDLRVEHSGDLVYHTGRDVRVKISAPYGEERGFSDVHFTLSAGRLGSVYSLKLENRLVEESEQKRFVENQESLVTISTSEANVSGIFHMALAFRDPDVPLVKQIQVSRSLILRPSNHSGPYPDDFLSFPYSQPNPYSDTNGQFEFKNCEIGSNCTMSCSAIGKITSMQVNRRSEGEEDWEPVHISELIFDYSRTVEWTIHPTRESQDMVFQCIAFTDTNNASMFTEVVLYSREFYIDPNRSGIVVEADQTNPDVSHVTVNCTIVGRPARRDVYFELYFEGSRSRYASAQPVPISVGEGVASVTVDLDPSTNPLDRFVRAACYASSTLYRHDEYVMEWP
ncbi:hypothetical protein RRG08_036405 [Elysia crispata]|uniref:Uncharacterized protein n=1 Tax=Elysia crispata TaxID=231223 RepID=A0AAE1DHE4_9GAST|nr:hypothetical protein RRG08_036405 [Elysia crispata]